MGVPGIHVRRSRPPGHAVGARAGGARPRARRPAGDLPAQPRRVHRSVSCLHPAGRDRRADQHPLSRPRDASHPRRCDAESRGGRRCLGVGTGRPAGVGDRRPHTRGGSAPRHALRRRPRRRHARRADLHVGDDGPGQRRGDHARQPLCERTDAGGCLALHRRRSPSVGASPLPRARPRQRRPLLAAVRLPHAAARTLRVRFRRRDAARLPPIGLLRRADDVRATAGGGPVGGA